MLANLCCDKFLALEQTGNEVSYGSYNEINVLVARLHSTSGFHVGSARGCVFFLCCIFASVYWATPLAASVTLPHPNPSRDLANNISGFAVVPTWTFKWTNHPEPPSQRLTQDKHATSLPTHFVRTSKNTTNRNVQTSKNTNQTHVCCFHSIAHIVTKCFKGIATDRSSISTINHLAASVQAQGANNDHPMDLKTTSMTLCTVKTHKNTRTTFRCSKKCSPCTMITTFH